MFGLGSPKKKKAEEFIFDLERDLKTPGERVSLTRKVEERIQQVKNILRSGENKEDFDQIGQLLQAYSALLRVMKRIK